MPPSTSSVDREGAGQPAPGAPRREPGRSPHIRVLLKSGFSSERIGDSDLASEVRVSFSGGRVQLLDSQGRVLENGSGFRLRPDPGRVLGFAGASYRGVMDVFVNPVGQPVIVNELDLEDYLKGVISNEISLYQQSREAVSAMTIAARSFAFSSLGQNAVRGFDVYSDTRSQVYGGVSSEAALSSQVVDETWGEVVAYGNKAIVAFYSSTCGGTTASYRETFQRDGLPYLEGGASCPDSASPYSSWDEQIDISRIQPLLDRMVGVGRLKKLEILDKGQWGRTVSMRFVGSRGDKVLRGLDIRSALGLKSNWITDFKLLLDGSGYVEGIRVKGRGWGHGLGLCQHGTMELARRGWTAERILQHYYLETEIVKFW